MGGREGNRSWGDVERAGDTPPLPPSLGGEGDEAGPTGRLLEGRVVALARPLVAEDLGVEEPEPFWEGEDGLRGVREADDDP